MNVDVGVLVDELKTLRKGRGMLAAKIEERAGQVVRRVSGVVDGDGPTELRTKVTARLRRLAEILPEDLRIGVIAAFALDTDIDMPFYQDRVAWAATRLRRDQRTVRRRIDEGIVRMAESALGTDDGGAGQHGSSSGWHIEELRVAVALDQARPEALEFRRVVADRDGVSELELAFTLTGPPDRSARLNAESLGVDVFYGGRLANKRMETSERTGFVLVLPTPLRRDETHDFLLRFRPQRDQPVLPHFVCVLKNRCDLFDLRVRFDPDNLPEDVRRLAGAFQRDVDDPAPTGELIEVDGIGEIRTQFRQVATGLTYGVRWQPRRSTGSTGSTATVEPERIG